MIGNGVLHYRDLSYGYGAHERNWSRTGRFIISFPFSFTSLAIQRKQLVDKIVCTLNDAFSTDGAGRCRYCHKFLIQRCGRSYHKYKWKIARTNHRAATVLYLELERKETPTAELGVVWCRRRRRKTTRFIDLFREWDRNRNFKDSSDQAQLKASGIVW